jgi:ubiquinone/menaquinone biosynthesis C-methylase UbiE
VFPPSEGSLRDDLDEAVHLASFSEPGSFRDLVVENSRISSNKAKRPPEIIDLYTRISLAAHQREANRFKELEFILEKFGWDPPEASLALDLGTGMGPAIPFLARRFKYVVGVDISLKHLVMAGCRCREGGCSNVTLVCACAERLPFADAQFSFVNSSDVLEHVADPAAYLRETERVLGRAGLYWSSTPNRYTLLNEGHVQLWGVGYVPRPLQRTYVRWLRHTGYEGIRPVSYREVSRLLGAVFEDYKIVLPVDMHDVLIPHPGVKPRPLWRVARAYWKLADGHTLLKRLASFLEKCFYPQFRFVARKAA